MYRMLLEIACYQYFNLLILLVCVFICSLIPFASFHSLWNFHPYIFPVPLPPPPVNPGKRGGHAYVIDLSKQVEIQKTTNSLLQW